MGNDRVMYLGIDPGSSGGLASIGGSGSARACSMPKTERDVWEWFVSFYPVVDSGRVFAVIEKVGGFIQGSPTPGSAMFNFGWGYGGLRMALVAAGIPFQEVPPQTWQKAAGITPRNAKGGESKTSWKNRLKAKAQQLFPDVAVTLATADALLIADYCRVKYERGDPR